ncbi:MAG TPA: DEAD/DEAH box helicase family protein [Candidatus Obscuribacterales bacterium]
MLSNSLPGSTPPLAGSNLSDEARALECLTFQYPFRRYQNEILELVKSKLERGEQELHIVAPPGAGKTIIGLQIIAHIKQPSLILCPNTTIQSQWGQKLDLFLPPEIQAFGTGQILGTHEDKPLKPITVLTYQVLSTPGREQEYLEKLAHSHWSQEVTRGRAISGGEAELRILELMQNNPKAYQREISRHVSRLRKKLADVMDLRDVLHPNALDLLQALRRQKFKVVVFDECHHLTDYWAAIMTLLVRYLDSPIIIGLTGTPPEGKTQSQENRYLSLVGNIDYQVPTPALVKEGGLAPFQDLVYFTHPTEEELQFLENQHREFHELVERLSKGKAISAKNPELVPCEKNDQLLHLDYDDDYVAGIITGGSGDDFYELANLELVDAASNHGEMRLSSGSMSHALSARAAGSRQNVSLPPKGSAEEPKARSASETDAPVAPLTAWAVRRVNETFYDEESKSFRSFLHSRPNLTLSYYRYLYKVGHKLPSNLPQTEAILQSPTIDDWMSILEDFASHKLKTSSERKDHELYDSIRSAARKLGYGISEQGLRRQASPIDRVLAFSRSKSHAVCRLLETEYASLQDRLRAVVVTDFERMSATSAKVLKGVIDEETGGAIATLTSLLTSPISAYVNPCLVTGSLLLVDKRICAQFVAACQEILAADGYDMELKVNNHGNAPYAEISASGSDWESRLYVALATSIFERGITKCLVGTRGLFGEGWDSQSLNTLIDLTTTTSPVSVKQLRGRSLRIHTQDPLGGRKVANNWDVVCIAPSLEKGLNDYNRFVRKHDGFFGISDDGQVECGVGHVHPSFSELTPIEVFASAETFNDEMLKRALVRDRIYDMWKVGEPYNNRSLGCVEVQGLRMPSLTPPHLRRNMKYREHARQMRAALTGIWIEHTAFGTICAGLFTFVFSTWGVPAFAAVLPVVASLVMAKRSFARLYRRFQTEVCEPNSREATLYAIALALLTALQRMRFLPKDIDRKSIKVSRREDGSFRVFLDDTEPTHAGVFTNAFKEVMAPITNQPFLMPKYEYSMPMVEKHSWLGRRKERQQAFFDLYLKEKAVPRIGSYHAVPKLLARSQKGRQAFQDAWNKYVSPGSIIETESKPHIVDRYFGIGPSLAERLLWE